MEKVLDALPVLEKSGLLQISNNFLRCCYFETKEFDARDSIFIRYAGKEGDLSWYRFCSLVSSFRPQLVEFTSASQNMELI